MATGCMGVCALGCGTAGRQASTSSVAGSTGGNTGDYASTITTSSIPLGQALRGDGDVDNPSDIDGNGDRDYTSQGGKDGDSDGPTRESYDFPDGDDRSTFAYGHSPSTAEARAISDVVREYYAAASADNGPAACALLLPSFASSLPESYGGAGGPSYLRGGRTCSAIESMTLSSSPLGAGRSHNGGRGACVWRQRAGVDWIETNASQQHLVGAGRWCLESCGDHRPALAVGDINLFELVA